MIELYADGAAFPNPGGMGIGIVLVYKQHVKEYGCHIGQGTNNIAELTAIKRGLELIKNKTIPVRIISDSKYALNVLNGSWQAKKNILLIKEIQNMFKEFQKIEFKWVRGHSGIKYQERADSLANYYVFNHKRKGEKNKCQRTP